MIPNTVICTFVKCMMHASTNGDNKKQCPLVMQIDPDWFLWFRAEGITLIYELLHSYSQCVGATRHTLIYIYIYI